jgi:voltage-gated potassium channel
MSGQSTVKNDAGSRPFGQLPRATRRRLLLWATLRLALTAVVLFGAYFLLPFTRLRDDASAATFAIGLLVLGLAVALQIRATLRAAHPGLRAAQALTTSILLFMVLFATTHFLVDAYDIGSYTQRMTRIDALYFVTTTLATVGYGDIAPVSEVARTLTIVQMVGGIVLLGIVAKVLLGAAQVAINRQKAEE